MISTSIRRAAAKRLRANTTPHERALWCALKELPVDGTHFRRQAPIGPYVVDFLCPAKHLIIELDGGHHSDDETAKRDREGSFGSNGKGTASFDFGIRRSGAI
jgi:very-short-patch-repair endonuclease